MVINHEAICTVLIGDPNKKDGSRFVDLGNYYRHKGKLIAVMSKEMAEQYGHLVDTPVYIRKKMEREA